MANVLIPDGEYYILNAASNNGSSGRCIDISGSQLLKDNATVQLYDMLRNDAQAFQVRNSGGKLIITSRLFGNRFGPVNTSSTAAVKLNAKGTGVPTNITWEVGETTTKKTHGGVSYDCYTLKYGSYNLYASGTTNNAVIRMSSGTGEAAQWYFIPISQVNDGGLFEIRSYNNTGMALDVAANGKLNGTNVQMYAANGTNAQKFIVQKESGDIYSIRCVESGRYVDVYAGTAKAGTNVQIFDKNSITRAQEWRVLEYGMTTINGVQGKIVSFGSMVDNKGNELFMTMDGSNVNIQTIYNDKHTFVLLPTTAEDPNMPVPHSIGISSGKTGAKKSYGYIEDESYLRWSCSAAWCADNGANHYELRYRTRLMDLTTASWKSWSSWSSWIIPAIETSGTSVTAYVEDLITDYGFKSGGTQARNEQIEIELRSVGADELSLLHSKSVTQTITMYNRPYITLTRAGWTPGGLQMEFTTDYLYGANYITVRRITCDGEDILKAPVEISGYGATQSETIDSDNFTSFVPDGAKLKIYYSVGYDQQRVTDTTWSKTITATYDAGNVDVEPAMEVNGAHVYAIVPHLGSERMWVVYDGRSVSCPFVGYRDNDSEAVFEVLYPTNGAEFSLFTEAYSLPDGARWGTDISRYKFKHISYAWTDEDGNTLYLNRFIDELPIYSYSHAATYQADNLDSRKFSTVSFAPTNTADLTAYGVLLKEEAHPETVKDFDELVGKHVVFRDIYGGIHNVAVTNVAISRHSKYDEVVVSMIEESI